MSPPHLSVSVLPLQNSSSSTDPIGIHTSHTSSNFDLTSERQIKISHFILLWLFLSLCLQIFAFLYSTVQHQEIITSNLSQIVLNLSTCFFLYKGPITQVVYIQKK